VMAVVASHFWSPVTVLAAGNIKNASGEILRYHGDEYGDGCLLAMTTEAVSTYETSASFYHITRRNIPEDGHLQNTSHLSPKIGLLHLHLDRDLGRVGHFLL
jgi:hypothetical protein